MSLIIAWWNDLKAFQPEIIAFALTTAGGITAYFMRASVKLIYGRANNSIHVLRPDQNTITVYCEKIYVQNIGRKPAENVEIVLICSPSEMTIFPARSYEKKFSPEGNLIISIPFISPGELIIIDTIHINNRIAEVLTVRCPDNVGKPVEFWVLRRFNPLIYLFLNLMVLLGVFYVVQLVITLLGFIGGR